MILLALFVLSVLLWLKGSRIWALLLLYVVATNGFQLKLLATEYDLSYLTFVFSLYAVVKYIKSNYRTLTTFSVESSIVILFLFMTLHFLATFIIGIDSIQHSFSVYRQWGNIGLFLLVKRMTPIEVNKSIFSLMLLTLCVGILYYTQFFGFDLFVEEKFITEFKRNAPPLYVFFAIYLWFSNQNIYKWIFIVFFISMAFFEGSRGSMGGVVLAFILYYAIIKRSYKILILGTVCFFAQNYISSLLSNELLNRHDVSMYEEIENSFSTDYRSFRGVRSEGTLKYRTAHLSERIDYLLDHPINIPFGIGSIAEQSPENRMHFYISTSGQIATNDLFWSTPLLRYGIIGILFFLTFFFALAKDYWKNERFLHAKIGLVFFFYLLMSSFNTDSFHTTPNIIALAMCFYLCKFEQENANVPHS